MSPAATHPTPTSVVIEAPDQLSEYAVVTLLAADRKIRVLPAAELGQADVLVIVTPVLTEFLRGRAEELLRTFPGPCILIVDRIDPAPDRRSPAAATGLLLRSEVTSELLTARIRQAARGAGHLRVAGESPTPPLDHRETLILRMLAEGLEIPEIASRLNCSEGNVRRILSLLMNRLGLSNRWQAVAYAFRADLL
ncbi:LuxR C-terminal-related transcriptional regulator [Kineosporia sp. NBRC 101731]|uniref:helix-turn-helix transcriptional regulator n=1 Tax=Kineosporia sp. NBRC 101731 TaxID=3032199 RepID=UPI0024A2A5F8|nr:LuxR C-terminal-related transcriptional regulator [Kineosporia sp. NBRC 101731]GLY28877.1 hypothetical protein Kisp02_22420 [Kineosporia sp. NBRC 101731]